MPARTTLPTLSPWRAFVARWKDCRDCGLCEVRKNVVLARGQVPCDVLFVGEAPGESEDVIGQPFVGPAGRLLDDIISRALGGPGTAWHGLRLAFTNLVCCIPRYDDEVRKAVEPDCNDVIACQPRLREFITVCEPRMVVAVGSLAAKWLRLRREYGIADSVGIIEIVHPAAILRANIAQQGLAAQRCVVQLRAAIEQMESH